MASLGCSTSLGPSSRSLAISPVPSSTLFPPSRLCLPSLFSHSPPRLFVVAMANPSPAAANMNEQLSKSIKQAEELCAGASESGECAAAWDEVEEISAEIANKRVRANEEKDPLEQYCKEEPEAEECRVYEE